LKPEFEAKPSKKTNVAAPGRINAPSAIGNFWKICDTSAAAIREYLGDGAGGPNLEKENGPTQGPLRTKHQIYKTPFRQQKYSDETPFC
jgi:hypothetical protein